MMVFWIIWVFFTNLFEFFANNVDEKRDMVGQIYRYVRKMGSPKHNMFFKWQNCVNTS